MTYCYVEKKRKENCKTNSKTSYGFQSIQKKDNNYTRKEQNLFNTGRYKGVVQCKGRGESYLKSYYKSDSVPDMSKWRTVSIKHDYGIEGITMKKFIESIDKFKEEPSKDTWRVIKANLLLLQRLGIAEFTQKFGVDDGTLLFGELSDLRMKTRVMERIVESNAFSSGNRLENDINAAITMVDNVRQKISSGNEHYTKYFISSTPTQKNKKRVLRTYQQIRNGLNWLQEDPYTKVQIVPKTESYGMTKKSKYTKAIIELRGEYANAGNTGKDSRPGVLIHELSHSFGGTNDHAYEEDIFTLSEYKAQRNADTYEYAAENV